MNTRHGRGRLAAAAAGVAMLAGCASWTPSLAPEDKPSTQDAYLYGRFAQESPRVLLGLDGYSTIGLVFKCQDGATYTVRFRREDDLQLLRVKPSTCSLQETIYTNADGNIKGHKPSPGGVMKGLVFKPGVAYYLGDYHGTMRTTIAYPGINMEWHIDSVRDRFATTTDALKERYPAFASVPSEDVMPPPVF
jgi:hypothetical protein